MKNLWTSAAAAALATFMAAGAANAQDTGTTAGAGDSPCTIQVIGTAPGGTAAGGATGGGADQILGAGGETHTINVVSGVRVMISAGPGTAGETAGVAGGTTTAGATAGHISTGDAMTLMSGNGCTVTVSPAT